MFAETFAWWLVIEGIGLIALPIALLLFRRLPGRGYAFAKPLGILLGGYLFWLALSAHLLPNRPGSIVWVFLLIIAVDVLLVRRYGRELSAALQERLGLIVAVEVLFAAAFFTAAHLRSYLPEISATEKPMDFMFLNAASRSVHYPPEDPWLAGFDVSYYYFGYLMQAMVGKLAAVKTSVAFNLGLCSTIALAATAAFGLGYDLASMLRRCTFRAAVAVGLAAVLFVSVLGNLEGALEFGVANGAVSTAEAESTDIANIETARQSDSCLLPVVCFKYPSEDSSFWWWWRATRISPDANSITEFPFFSFILGDLHPHVMAMPFVLMAFALAVNFWRWETRLSIDTWRRHWPALLPAAVCLGALGFLNAWDLPTLAFLVSALVMLRNLAGGEQPVDAREGPRTELRPYIASSLRDTAGFMAPLGVLVFLLYAPFYSGFETQASGVNPVIDEATKPLHSFLFWVPLLAVTLPLPLVRVVQAKAWEGAHWQWASAVPFVLFVAWVFMVAVEGGGIGDATSARGLNWLTAVFYGCALAVCLLALLIALREGDAEDSASVPVLAAISAAVLLIFGAELFYIDDFFASRLNSVFKLYYQAWLLLGIGGAFSVYWLIDRWQPARGTLPDLARLSWSGIAALCLAGALLYPLGTTLSRTEGLSRPGRTLDGLAAARAALPRDYALAQWLGTRAGTGERIVEAVGTSYSPAGRISAWTGVPSVLGWPGHEAQWGRDGRLLAERDGDVRTIYSTTSLTEAMALLQKYEVTYIVVGSVERATYPAAGLAKFEQGLVKVYGDGDASIFRMPPAEPAPVEASR
jgi:YYY domain-containing protein